MKTLREFGRMPIALTGPALAILLVVLGIPIVQLLLTSFNAPAFSTANYKAFFGQQANVRVLFQTIEISVVATAISLVVGYPTAYLIVAASKRLRIALIVFILVPYLTSGLVRTYAWVVILGDRGLINSLLIDHGLISSPLLLIYNRMAVYIGMVHIMLPMMILPLISVMMGIDKSLMAAARSMGARPSTAFWRVFFPLSMPGVRSGCLLVFVVCLGFYITPAALGGLGDAMLSTFIAAQVRSSFNMAHVATSAFVLLAVAIVVLSLVGLDLSGTQGRTTQQALKPWRGLSPSLGAMKCYLSEFFISYRAKRWMAQLYRTGGNSRRPQIVGAVFLALVMCYLLFPELVVVIMSFSGGRYLEFPPLSFSLQWYRSFFADPSWYGAAWISVKIAVMVVILSTTTGTLAAFGLNRTLPRLRSFLTMAMLTPITFPVIVVGIATYLGLVKLGLLDSMTGTVLAHTLGAIGYVVVIVSASLANFDPQLEQAAMSMRAGPLQTFIRVTLPLIRPGIIAGAVFAFLHSFDEVVITSLVGGMSMRTLPLKMWEDIRHQIDPTIAAVATLVTLLPLFMLMILFVAGWRSTLGLQRARPAVRGE
ncbi:ABC transporter permease subunit [Mesorhizobium humile]|uniref:ABC transporter permease subunit n=1 Tax=Mesorhizobium humile TaxID=3072313 RepID=A0ABU4YL42_9HYPH|nr:MULTISPECIES: ABC transporter permease subunit [unclassified Mesorhizobium]MDX8462480.1 ABC transporter permease subunit [Mesorhizobium sp. VK2D]MDX8487676.1 ABC transporter permease subunit [Mesorhizobium sp. VK2B]